MLCPLSSFPAAMCMTEQQVGQLPSCLENMTCLLEDQQVCNRELNGAIDQLACADSGVCLSSLLSLHCTFHARELESLPVQRKHTNMYAVSSMQ
jgi:hypothetical protein